MSEDQEAVSLKDRASCSFHRCGKHAELLHLAPKWRLLTTCCCLSKMSGPAPERKSQGRTGESGAAGTKVPHVYTHAKRSYTYVKDPVVHVRVRWTTKTSKITQHAQRSVRAFTVLKLDTIQKKKNLITADTVKSTSSAR